MSKDHNLLVLSIEAAVEAGKTILEVYNTSFEVDYKADNSPLTLADQKAHHIISGYLKTTGIPVLSEEGRATLWEQRRHWNECWIVDPLDGTKEFVKRNGEFTVNIALVSQQKPVLGVVFCPTLNLLYFTDEEFGKSYKVQLPKKWNEVKPSTISLIETATELPEINNKSGLVVASSRSHLSEETKAFVSGLEKKVGKLEYITKGSSLKLCMVAEGTADLYPRFAPTSEWDTAAGHAIVQNAGAQLIEPKSRYPLRYNKENILNPWFIAVRNDVAEKFEI